MHDSAYRWFQKSDFIGNTLGVNKSANDLSVIMELSWLIVAGASGAEMWKDRCRKRRRDVIELVPSFRTIPQVKKRQPIPML